MRPFARRTRPLGRPAFTAAPESGHATARGTASASMGRTWASARTLPWSMVGRTKLLARFRSRLP